MEQVLYLLHVECCQLTVGKLRAMSISGSHSDAQDINTYDPIYILHSHTPYFGLYI
jgi:hypothetical protein